MDHSHTDQQIIQAVHEIVKRGYGEVVVRIHEGRVQQVLKTESIHPKPDAA